MSNWLICFACVCLNLMLVSDFLILLIYLFSVFLGDFRFFYLCLLWPCRFYLLLIGLFFLSAKHCADTHTHATVCAFDLFFVQITFSKTDISYWIIFSDHFTYRILTPPQEAFLDMSSFAMDEFCWLLVTSWWSSCLCCQIHFTKSRKLVPGLLQGCFPQMTCASAVPLGAVQHW